MVDWRKFLAKASIPALGHVIGNLIVGVLQALGIWPFLLAIVTSVITAVGATIEGLPGSVVLVLMLAAFALILFIIFYSKKIFAKQTMAVNENHRSEKTTKEATPLPLTARDCELNHALFWIVDSSAWMRWQFAQRLAGDGKSLDEIQKMGLAAHVVLIRAENGELAIKGRRQGRVEYEPISRDFWKVAFLDVQPHSKTLWRVTVRPRSGLSEEEISQIPNYKSLQTEWAKIREYWPKHEKELDALTTELLTKADNKKSQTEEKDLQPDTSVCEAINDWLLDKSEWGIGKDHTQALGELRQVAHNAEILVWGRRRRTPSQRTD